MCNLDRRARGHWTGHLRPRPPCKLHGPELARAGEGYAESVCWAVPRHRVVANAGPWDAISDDLVAVRDARLIFLVRERGSHPRNGE
eukprot:CAMPEP_0177220812 /NCGR_PEP_ID=MMETSP0367-20130122/37087_1 /TAXON_ID=447022 ORGANISM="Scrippsiella hangoei-like, Strain SHHI-4" /NCGR_SAMPLE_ID=MMETSP0367 /ASSEMBLY_ACC=CAM_ASM_000362 /LENGTH=86 /DNA_ID=CAMNT_0018670613 /DNA_START=319 /DNA_END=577 /DNA_ORIENTATION=+